MKAILKSLVFGIVTMFSLTYFIQIRQGARLDLVITLRYLLVSLVVMAYTWILDVKNLRYAWLCYTGFFLAATIYLGVNMGNHAEIFADLGTVLMWMILQGAGVLIGLLIELIRVLKEYFNASA